MVRVTNNKQDMLMTTLTNFYRNPDNIAIFLPIVQGRSRISLRLIDWMTTNYSKAHNVIYPVEYVVNGQTRVNQFLVHTNYKSQLRAYSKRLFDPFQRGENIIFEFEKGKCVRSTVGQLNFFRWVITNKILQYMLENLEAIELDMYTAAKSSVGVCPADVEAGAEIDAKPVRKPLSISANRTVCKHQCVMTVTFS